MTSRAASLSVAVLLSMPGAALADPPVKRPAVAVALAGDEAPAAEVRAALAADPGAPVEVRFVELPSLAAEEAPSGEIESLLADARRDYIDAESDRCLDRLEGIDVLRGLLGESRRGLAGRVLFWRIACRFLAGSTEDASREAHAFAVLGLDVPADVEAATPEVEALLGRALREIAATPRARLRVGVNARRASVSVDGRRDVCAVSCTIDVPPGDHVVRVDADGREPAVRVVRVEAEGTRVAVETAPAPPETAARQWTARYAGSPAVDSAPSVRLLASALRSRRIVLVVADREARGARLRGVLAVNEAVAARAERTSERPEDLGEDARELLRELLERGGVVEPAPPLVKRPIFWIAVGLAATAAAVGTALLLYEPPTRTEVHF